MGDLGAIHDPVPFDHAAASLLIARLNAGAKLLREQKPRRKKLAATARKDWRGVYDGRFVARMVVCDTDAERLATALEKAAEQLEELKQLATEEEARREVARKYEKDLAAWRKRQDDRSALETVKGWVGAGEDKPRPPRGPVSKRELTAEPLPMNARGD